MTRKVRVKIVNFPKEAPRDHVLPCSLGLADTLASRLNNTYNADAKSQSELQDAVISIARSENLPNEFFTSPGITTGSYLLDAKRMSITFTWTWEEI